MTERSMSNIMQQGSESNGVIIMIINIGDMFILIFAKLTSKLGISLQ